ncbi:MAG: redoxin family protein [Sphingomonas sp.]|uniref:redoxin family protein n=1 Tax=Sphingomonas sp. TaxID=28214 RepID=UPI001ACCD10E|nr:redoxin family protein [Sphingomonas sp.]MBN8807707.1 redoxin family protein [Sphingomonas sp.]
MRRALLWLPLVLFAGLFALVGFGLLRPASRTVHSALTDKPLPDFALPAMLPTKPGVARTAYGGGQPRLINVFGSWCVPCRAEAPALAKLAAAGVPIDGIAINDTPDGVRDFLARYGDPFQRIGNDAGGRVQVTLGSAGVPETFLVDGKGRIVRQYVSNLQDDQVADILRAWKAAK